MNNNLMTINFKEIDCKELLIYLNTNELCFADGIACELGTWGDVCTEECHCLNGAPCFWSNGNCWNNLCVIGWKGSACNELKGT